MVRSLLLGVVLLLAAGQSGAQAPSCCARAAAPEQRDQLGRPVVTRLQESKFALAIARSAKKGIIEESVEAYSEVLIQCQKERSVVLTTPLLRSESQQAHCYRF
ncbi:MAG: hypothetical protein V4633_08310 [Pseudomonadota bacterium]